MEIISFWNNVNFEDFHRRHLQSGFTTDEFIVTTTHSVPDQVVSVNRPFVQLIDVQYNDEKISSI